MVGPYRIERYIVIPCSVSSKVTRGVAKGGPGTPPPNPITLKKLLRIKRVRTRHALRIRPDRTVNVLCKNLVAMTSFIQNATDCD